MSYQIISKTKRMMIQINKQRFQTFNPLNVSSKFAICGIPIRVDTYKTCSFGCKYCFSNYRTIMEFEKTLKLGNVQSVKKDYIPFLIKISLLKIIFWIN